MAIIIMMMMMNQCLYCDKPATHFRDIRGLDDELLLSFNLRICQMIIKTITMIIRTIMMMIITTVMMFMAITTVQDHLL